MDFENVISLLRKYDFSSTTTHPFIFLDNDNIGICFAYYDENYGYLERVKFFKNLEILEDFLKKLKWFRDNGKANNVNIVLDDYTIINPKVVFLRDKKVMVKGEMFDIAGFDMREKQKDQLDEISRTILEAGNLLLIYDEIKNRQNEYLNSVNILCNELRRKYHELQDQVDKYNDFHVERAISLLPETVVNEAINELMEKSAKDRYGIYKTNHPSLEEAKSFVREVWELNMNLELNRKYYEAQVVENNTRNEIRVVNKKLAFMKKLNEEDKGIFRIDLVKEFRKINYECAQNSILISDDFVNAKMRSVEKKYSYYGVVDLIYLANFLKECTYDTNYADVALKYCSSLKVKDIRKPLNIIASDLFVQYRDNLTINEQAIIVLYNSKYRDLFDLILAIPEFSNKTVQEINKIISKSKGFSKIKSECYDIVKTRISDPINANIKNKIFANINFDSYELFLESIINQLKLLLGISNKIVMSSDVNMYFLVNNINDINSKKFISITNDLNTLKSKIVNNTDLIAITTLKYGLPVIYSPYYLDFGDMYQKETVKMEIREMNRFDLLIDINQVIININNDDNITTVIDYVSNKKVVGDVTLVDQLNVQQQVRYCKLACAGKNNYNQTGVINNG